MSSRKKNISASLPPSQMIWESAQLNTDTFNDYYYRLVDLAINMFEWLNLPSTVDERFLELTLFGNGMALFFEDDKIGYLALSAMAGGQLNVYRTPIIRTAYANNGYTNTLNEDNSVLIYNNYLRTPSMLPIELYARRLYELERSIDVNVKAQKTPVIIHCTEQQRLTMKNLFMQYDGNEPFIFGDKSLDLDSVKVIQTNAPYVADKLQILKRDIWREALVYLGIEIVNDVKKERLISNEVEYSLAEPIAQRTTKLNARKQACKQINEMFGLDVDVRFRSINVYLSEQGNVITLDEDNNG